MRPRQPLRRLAPLLLITPLFPPAQGGLPDHTDHLAQALTAHFDVAVLTSPGADTARAYRVHARVEHWGKASVVMDHVERVAPAGPLVWEYVPHMYGRGGVNLVVPRVLRELKRRGRRQLVLAHEIRAPFSWWPHRSWYALAHRLMWRGVLAAADSIGVSTGGWLEQLEREGVAPGRMFLAPSPSNVPVLPVEAGHAAKWRESVGLGGARGVVGFFGMLGSNKQFDWVLAAWRAVRRVEPATALVVIGGRPSVTLAPGEEPWFCPLGYLRATESSPILQAIDLLLLPFSDGVSERRSSFMTALAHGLPVLATIGPATGRELRASDCYEGVDGPAEAFAAAAANLMAAPERRRELGARAVRHYRAVYDWPVLATMLRDRVARMEAGAAWRSR